MEQARDELRQAVRLKPAAWSPRWDYARLAQNEPGERNEVLTALHEVVRLNPKNLDAQLLLGHHLVATDKPKQALDILDALRGVPPAKAAGMFVTMAWAHAKLNEPEPARVAVLNALKYAKDPADIESARRFVDYLKRRRDSGSRSCTPGAAGSGSHGLAHTGCPGPYQGSRNGTRSRYGRAGLPL